MIFRNKKPTSYIAEMFVNYQIKMKDIIQKIAWMYILSVL